jgi:hypothetical protein
MEISLLAQTGSQPPAGKSHFMNIYPSDGIDSLREWKLACFRRLEVSLRLEKSISKHLSFGWNRSTS